MTLPAMNYWVILLAAVLAFALGGLWYSPLLFLKAWTREARMDEAGKGHPAKVFGTSFAFALIAAFFFAFLLGPNPGMVNALPLGLTVGIGFVAATFGINYQFANRGWKLWWIDAGYNVALFVVFGLVFGWLG
ncbi:MAG: hypothetical protein K0Q91_385 [Fibrobacteria bacterium]|jgi:hypothetical protein|nr:hypothetical protein [Fibrobacteria bacterium]